MRGGVLFRGFSIGVIVVLAVVALVWLLERRVTRTEAPASNAAPQSETSPSGAAAGQAGSAISIPSGAAPVERERVSVAASSPNSRDATGTQASPSGSRVAANTVAGGAAREPEPTVTRVPVHPESDAVPEDRAGEVPKRSAADTASLAAGFRAGAATPSPVPGPTSNPAPTPPQALSPAPPTPAEIPWHPGRPPRRPPPNPTPTPTPTAARVWIVAEPSEPAAGDVLVIHVMIDGASDAASVPFHLVFNPAVLRFEAGYEGSFLSGGGGQVAFFASPTSTGERIVVGLSRLGGEQGVSGAGELCSLRFTALAPGDAGVGFERAKVRDPRNKIVPASFAPVSITLR